MVVGLLAGGLVLALIGVRPASACTIIGDPPYVKGPVIETVPLGIAALDDSGNVGPETTIRITSEPGGCTSSRNGGAWSLVWVIAALGLVARKRG